MMEFTQKSIVSFEFAGDSSNPFEDVEGKHCFNRALDSKLVLGSNGVADLMCWLYGYGPFGQIYD